MDDWHLPGLEVDVEHSGAYAIIHMTGELDLATTAELREVVAEQLDLGYSLIVDLSGVTFLDASGVGVLMEGANGARDRYLSMVVAGSTGVVARVLDLTEAMPWINTGGGVEGGLPLAP